MRVQRSPRRLGRESTAQRWSCELRRRQLSRHGFRVNRHRPGRRRLVGPGVQPWRISWRGQRCEPFSHIEVTTAEPVSMSAIASSVNLVANPRPLPQRPRSSEADLLGASPPEDRVARTSAVLAPSAPGVRDPLRRALRGGRVVTGRRDIHRLPTGARASEGPAPVDSPWISLRAPMRRRPSTDRVYAERHVRTELLQWQGTVETTGLSKGGPNTEILTLLSRRLRDTASSVLGSPPPRTGRSTLLVSLHPGPAVARLHTFVHARRHYPHKTVPDYHSS